MPTDFRRPAAFAVGPAGAAAVLVGGALLGRAHPISIPFVLGAALACPALGLYGLLSDNSVQDDARATWWVPFWVGVVHFASAAAAAVGLYLAAGYWPIDEENPVGRVHMSQSEEIGASMALIPVLGIASMLAVAYTPWAVLIGTTMVVTFRVAWPRRRFAGTNDGDAEP